MSETTVTRARTALVCQVVYRRQGVVEQRLNARQANGQIVTWRPAAPRMARCRHHLLAGTRTDQSSRHPGDGADGAR